MLVNVSVMPFAKYYDPKLLETLVGGASALDHPNLHFHDLDEAGAFIRCYGYDLKNEDDAARLWSYHHRAISFIQNQLLSPEERIPKELAEPPLLKDLGNLLLWAGDTSEEGRLRRKWCCGILRVMHVITHLSNDLFTFFAEDIQEQIMQPYQQVVTADESGRTFLGPAGNSESIPIVKFDIKPFKTSNSSITKLLAKPEEVAFGLLDKMGVRFVTNSIFDCFRVMHWLVTNNVVSFPHLIPDQSNNTLYPLNLFTEVMAEMRERGINSPELVEEHLRKKISTENGRATYREKLNIFTSREYRFIKFIVRRLIRAKTEGRDRPFMFFYPYEIQIVDIETFKKNSTGPSSHGEYKARQRQRARERVFGREPFL